MSDLNPPPVVFDAEPRIDEVVAAVNRTDAITMMQSTSTTVKLLDSPVPRLNASLALERPRRFRLRASLPILLGASLDVGSNDELFWMRYPDDGVRQTLLYARHDQFQPQMPGSPLPVDPTWLIEALGLVHIDPDLVHHGPVSRGDGQLEVRTWVQTAGGNYNRVLFIDKEHGFVSSQYLYGPDGRLVASATGAEHNYYDEHRVVLPHSVHIYLAASGGSPPVGLQVEIGSYALNQLLGDDPRQFEMPSEGNHQVVDLSRLSGMAAPPSLEQAPADEATPGATPIDPSLVHPPGAASPFRPPGVERDDPSGTASSGTASSGTTSGGTAAPVEPVRQYVPTATHLPTLRGMLRR